MDVRLPDGTIIKNVPDGITKAELVSKLKANGMDVSGLEPKASHEVPPVDNSVPKWGQEHPNLYAAAEIGKDLGLGALKGATNIGSTILGAVPGTMPMAQRKAALNQFYQQNANTQSPVFKTGELGSEIAGTAGAGGALAKGVEAGAGALGLEEAPLMQKIAAGLESGGFRLGSPATSMAGKVGNAAIRLGTAGAVGGAAGGIVNPEHAGESALIGAAMPGGAKVGATAGKLVGGGLERLVGRATGVGGENIGEALRSGMNGNEAFLQNMRGEAPMEGMLTQAKAALNNMRSQRAAAYRQGMQGVSNDKTVLDFKPILDELKNQAETATFKGKVLDKNASGTRQEITRLIEDWAQSDPAEYHTPEGMDALKRAIGDVRDSTQFGTPSRHVADSLYNAVKDQIVKQAPDYAKVMKDYWNASNQLNEITKTLSLGEKSSADTALRKLQSLTRNNVNTNYGNRIRLAKELVEQGGAPNLVPSIAGQAMSSWLPRGLVGGVESGGALLGLIHNPMLLMRPESALLGLTSPRLMGEALYAGGRGLGAVGNVAKKAVKGLTESQRRAMIRQLTSVPAVMSAE